MVAGPLKKDVYKNIRMKIFQEKKNGVCQRIILKQKKNAVKCLPAIFFFFFKYFEIRKQTTKHEGTALFSKKWSLLLAI
jgi:hypothetical protein